MPVALASRPLAITGVRRSAAASTVRVARTPADLLAAARLRASAARGGHPAGLARIVEVNLDEYDAQALHLLAVDEEEPVGTMRLLRAQTGRQLPVQRVFDLPDPGSARIAELSRPAVRRPDDQALLVALLRAAYDEALAGGIDEVYLVADQGLLTVLRALGFRFRPLSGPVWAYGAWNIAAVLTVDDVVPGLRMHQAVHGCQIADYFTAPFDGAAPADTVCLRSAS
ncbi:MAG: GNAT family N-acyltransferase [Actinomycetes bacterium]